MEEIIYKLVKLSKASNVKAYLVGGFLRDLLLGYRQAVKDIDVVVEGELETFCEILAKALPGTLIPLGERFSTYRIIKEDYQIDISAIQAETIEADLLRRDFTIDAMAVEVTQIKNLEAINNIIDPLGAIKDIDGKLVRQVSHQNLLEDPLRMLRGFRLAATLNFKIEAATAANIKANSGLITKVAKERIRDELFLILNLPASYNWVKRLYKIGLLKYIFPEIVVMEGTEQDDYHHLDVFLHSLDTLKQLEILLYKSKRLPQALLEQVKKILEQYFSGKRKRLALLKLAALLHDVAKPATKTVEIDRIRFIGHERLGAELCRKIAIRELKLSKKEANLLAAIVKGHLRPGFLSELQTITARAKYRFFRDLGDACVDTLILSLSDRLATRGLAVSEEAIERHRNLVVSFLDEYFKAKEAAKQKPIIKRRLLTGDDLISEFNLSPGPLIGKILKAVEEAQALGEIDTKSEARRLVEKLLSRNESIVKIRTKNL